MLDTQVPPGSGVQAAAPEGGKRRPGRRLLVVALILGYLANVVLRVWLTHRITMPIAHTDEDSYLNTARVFAGDPGGYSSENSLLRRVGYAWLISPAFLGDQPFTSSYRLVQLLNAIYNSTIFPLAYLFARSALRLSWRRSLLLGLAIGVMPATVFWSEVAMTDVVLAPLTVAWVLMIVLWLRRPASLWWSAGAAAVAGVYYMMHVRGAVILAVHLFLVLVLTVARRIKIRSLVAAVLASAAVVAFHQVLLASLGDKLHLPGGDVAASTAKQLSSASLVKVLTIVVGTQAWYVAAASLGLVVIGWLYGVRVVRRRDSETPLRWALAAGLLATAGVSLGCALLLATTLSATKDLVYARYVEAFVPLWTLVGIAGLTAVRRRTAAWWGLVTAALILGGGLLVQIRLDRTRAEGHQLNHGIFGSPELLSLDFLSRRAHPLFFSVVTLVLAAVIFLLIRGVPARWAKNGRLWVAGVTLFLVANVAMLVAIRVPVANQLGRVNPTPTLAALGVHDGDRVWTTSNAPWLLRLNMAHEVTWYDVRPFRPDETPPADAQVVIAKWSTTSSDSWNGEPYGFTYVGGNVKQGWALWRR